MVVDGERNGLRAGVAARFGSADPAVIGMVPLFKGMPVDTISRLLATARAEDASRGQILFVQDEPADRFYVVLDGWVKLFRETEAGQESVLAIFGPGETFAEAAMFEQGSFPASAVAVTAAKLLMVPAASFLRHIRENPDYALNIMATMSRHLRRLVDQVEQLTVRSSTERVAGFLVHLTHRTSGAAVVRLPMEKALIAGRLGMQPETLSRCLARLRALGVDASGEDVRINDVAQLRRLTGEQMNS